MSHQNPLEESPMKPSKSFKVASAVLLTAIISLAITPMLASDYPATPAAANRRNGKKAPRVTAIGPAVLKSAQDSLRELVSKETAAGNLKAEHITKLFPLATPEDAELIANNAQNDDNLKKALLNPDTTGLAQLADVSLDKLKTALERILDAHNEKSIEAVRKTLEQLPKDSPHRENLEKIISNTTKSPHGRSHSEDGAIGNNLRSKRFLDFGVSKEEVQEEQRRVEHEKLSRDNLKNTAEIAKLTKQLKDGGEDVTKLKEQIADLQKLTKNADDGKKKSGDSWTHKLWIPGGVVISGCLYLLLKQYNKGKVAAKPAKAA